MNKTCVTCHQPLPSMSKLTKQVIPQDEATDKSWDGTRNGDGTVTVSMCLQCQIDRAEKSRRI